MGLSVGQILIVLLLVLILFGAGKLPKVMGDLGKGMRNFKAGIKGELDESEDEAKPIDADKKDEAE